MTKKYYSDSEDQDGPSDLELRKLAGSGGKLEIHNDKVEVSFGLIHLHSTH